MITIRVLHAVHSNHNHLFKNDGKKPVDEMQSRKYLFVLSDIKIAYFI